VDGDTNNKLTMKKIFLISLLAAPFLADAQSNLKPVIAQKRMR
jgi:hypothetical protein